MAQQTVSAEILANLFKVSTRYIRKLAKDEVIPKIKKGEYPLLHCVTAYIVFLRQIRGGAELEESKKRKAYSDALLAEIDVANAQGRIIPIEAHVGIIEKITEIIKTRLMQMPASLALELANEGKKPKVQEILDKNVRQILTELARVVATFSSSMEEGEGGTSESSEVVFPSSETKD